MPRDIPKTIRFSEEVYDALVQAAKADRRPVATLAEILIEDWLVQHGWLRDDDRSLSNP